MLIAANDARGMINFDDRDFIAFSLRFGFRHASPCVDLLRKSGWTYRSLA